MNAVLSGLVSISASCNNVGVSSSCIIGSIAALSSMSAGRLLNRYKIDDPIGSFQIFGFSGFWGCLAVGIFDKDLGLINTGSFEQLEVQALGCLVIIAWSSIFSTIFFRIFKAIGRLRVNQFYEVIGIDLLMHQSFNDLKIQKLSGDIYQTSHRTHGQSQITGVSISAFKSDIKLAKMDNDRKKALIGRLQNFQRKDAKKQYEEEYYDDQIIV